MSRLATTVLLTALQVLSASDPSQGEQETRDAAPSPDLVVLFHAVNSGYDSLDQVRGLVKTQFPEADILPRERDGGGYRDLPHKRAYSFVPPEDTVARLVKELDDAWAAKVAADGHGYRQIQFIGHSVGALFARKLYVVGSGKPPDRLAGPFPTEFEEELHEALKRVSADPIGPTARVWAPHVSRIVLLAGMNRGWSISHQVSKTDAFLRSVGAGAAQAFARVVRPVQLLSFRRGAPFMTQLRLQWLAMRAAARRGSAAGGATVVQLLGSVDDLVSPQDNIDLVAGRDFIYLDVDYTGHKDVIDVGRPDDWGEGNGACGSDRPQKCREQLLVQALTMADEELRGEQDLPSDEELVIRDDVETVVFVIHGIRDLGFWTQKIARRVIQRSRDLFGPGADGSSKVASVTSGYGYFPMLSFLRPGMREAKVEWFVERYAEAMATYPNAETFHFVGHSNGTYLLARALEKYPSVKFDRVVLAGSVLPRRFDWGRFLEGQIAGGVVNLVARSDWVVAFFPKALGMLRLDKVGSAGHDGFRTAELDPRIEELGSEVVDGRGATLDRDFVQGGHNGGLDERGWDAIADYLLTGELDSSAWPVEASRAAWVVFFGWIAPIVWGGIVFLLYVGYRAGCWVVAALIYRRRAFAKWPPAPPTGGLGKRTWQRFWKFLKTQPIHSERLAAFYIVAFLALVWNVLTKF